ncbi:MAG: DUF6799 domain-containing protein [Chitinophagaceae bacterium]
MKKIILLFAFFAMAAGVSAQETKKMKDYVVMKDGKMMVVKDGKTTAMEKDMTLADGTRVMVDGKVMMKDGSTKILKDGESVIIEGRTDKTPRKKNEVTR